VPLKHVVAVWLRMKAIVHRRRLDRDLDDELAFHLAMRAQQQGGDPAAHAAARRQFGNLARIRETCRALWTFAILETLWQDLRYGVRTLAKTRAFSLVAILSLALGIGVNAALFSLADAMLLRALPVRNPQQLVEFVRAGDGSLCTNLPRPVFQRFRQDRDLLSDVFAIDESTLALGAGGVTEPATAHVVSGSFFPALGVQPLIGRTIGPNDDLAGAAHQVAVLSYPFWSRRFGRDPSILGATVRLSGEPVTVIGIMPPQFFGLDRGRVPDLWIPLAAEREAGDLWVLGRLRPGISIARARLQLSPLFHQALEDELQSSSRGWDRKAFLSSRLLVNRATQGTSGVRWDYWDYSNTLKILIGLTALVLLIACANLANLLMARSAARSREIGIRLAVGAGRWRLVRQLMTESLLLSLTGGALGLLAAGWGHRLVLGFLVDEPSGVALDFQLDYRLLAFCLALSVATGLLFGLMPALRATRAETSGVIYQAGRQRGAWNMPVAKGLLAFQIGLSMMLLIGAGLFARSLRNLAAADLGFAREDLTMMDVGAAGKTPQARRRFWKELTGRVARLPGVRSVALAGDAVFGNGGWNQTVWIERPGQPAQKADVSDNLVSPGFFATTGIPVLSGREFSEQDRENAPLVALVNQTFARRFFANENPLGRRFGSDGPASGDRYQIAGVVGDAKYGSVRERPRAMVFYPMWQEPARTGMVLHLRTAGPPAAVNAAIQRQIEALDGDAMIGAIRTLPQVLHGELREDRMFATLAGFFALLALALGAIGIYGIVAYRVERRTAEIGIRVALGAQKGAVLWLIMREMLMLLVAGSAIGVPGALLVARLVKSQLFGLDPWDPLTIVSATTVLFAAGVLAGFVPASRAASLQPTQALRSD